jgi:hypothetical protein
MLLRGPGYAFDKVGFAAWGIEGVETAVVAALG